MIFDIAGLAKKQALKQFESADQSYLITRPSQKTPQIIMGYEIFDKTFKVAFLKKWLRRVGWVKKAT